MIRKTTALLLILVANIVLLVHVIIPHHHHQSITCIVNTHCSNDNKAEHNHEHDGNESTNSCVLKQAVIVPSSVEKLFKCSDNCANHDYYNFYILPISNNEKTPKLIVFSSVPDLSFQYLSFATNSLGLRAPPMI